MNKDDELYHYSYGSGLSQSGDELYHYGVPGMRWGRRKAVPTSINNTRAERKAIKQELKLEKKRIKAEQKEIKAERKEINRYANKMFKNGRPGSEADIYSKGKSTALYNTLLKTKGKKFTDKVMELTTRKIDREEAASAAAERERRILGYINAFTSGMRREDD